MLTAMTYSDETMARMEESIRAARLAIGGIGTAAETVAESLELLADDPLWECASCHYPKHYAPGSLCLTPELHTAVPVPSGEWPPNIGDTCCGKCEGPCYVDGVTGA